MLNLYKNILRFAFHVMRFYVFRNWVIASVIPWMATTDSFHPQPDAFQNSKAVNRFIGILAAGWMKTA